MLSFHTGLDVWNDKVYISLKCYSYISVGVCSVTNACLVFRPSSTPWFCYLACVLGAAVQAADGHAEGDDRQAEKDA